MKLRQRPQPDDVDEAIARLNARVHPPPNPEPPVDIEAAVDAAIARRDRAARAERRRQQLARATAPSPCVWCGTVAMVADCGFFDGPLGPACPSCDWHVVDRTFAAPDGARDYAAHFLLGFGDQGAPLGLGALVGLKFWRELDDPPMDARSPFSWVTAGVIEGWRTKHGLVVGTPGRLAW